MHVFAAPRLLIAAIFLVASVLARPVPSGTGGGGSSSSSSSSGQGPIKPRSVVVSNFLGRSPRSERSRGLSRPVRRVPVVADLLYPESMIPGRFPYLSVKEQLPSDAGDGHSARYKCLEMCVGRKYERWRHRGDDPTWAVIDVLQEWNECIDGPKCQKLSGHVQKIPHQVVQTHQADLEAQKKEETEARNRMLDDDEERRQVWKRAALERGWVKSMLQDPEYLRWVQDFEAKLNRLKKEQQQQQRQQQRQQQDDEKRRRGEGEEKEEGEEEDNSSPLKMVRENLGDQINALPSRIPRYFGGSNNNGQSKFGGRGGRPIFKPGRVR